MISMFIKRKERLGFKQWDSMYKGTGVGRDTGKTKKLTELWQPEWPGKEDYGIWGGMEDEIATGLSFSNFYSFFQIAKIFFQSTKAFYT